MTRFPHHLIHDRLAPFVTAHAQIAPGALGSLILTGSAITEDWRPDQSDIDVVFVMNRHLELNELARISELHLASLEGSPIDGVYLSEMELAAGPAAIASAPQAVDGVLSLAQSGGQLTWITWCEIEVGFEAIVNQGGSLGTWQPVQRRFAGAQAGAKAHARQNLHEYWSPLAAKARSELETRAAEDPVSSASVQWLAMGPGRLAATIESGQIISKSAGAIYSAQRWPQYDDLLERTVCAREGADPKFVVADALAATSLIDAVASSFPIDTLGP